MRALSIFAIKFAFTWALIPGSAMIRLITSTFVASISFWLNGVGGEGVGLTSGEGVGLASGEGVGLASGEGVGLASGEGVGLASGVGVGRGEGGSVGW